LRQRQENLGGANATPLARLTEALDRLIEFYTATNQPEEVRKWQAERAKYANVAPTPPAM
jgi:hypothetical protein